MFSLLAAVLGGCVPEAGPAVPEPTCEDAETVGSVSGPIVASEAAGLCEGWCSLTVEGDLTVDLPLSADQVDDLSCIEAVHGTLWISGTEGSADAAVGLDRLRYVEGSMIVGTSGTVSGLDGLASLQWVSGDLQVVHSGITDLAGLPALESVGLLSFFWNEQLVDLSGLDSLVLVQETLTFSGNPCLPPEPIDALVDRLGDAGIGTLRVEDNGPCGGAE